MNIHEYSWVGPGAPPASSVQAARKAILSLLGRVGGRGAFMNIHEYSWGVQVPPREFGLVSGVGHPVLIGPLGRPGRLHGYS